MGITAGVGAVSPVRRIPLVWAANTKGKRAFLQCSSWRRRTAAMGHFLPPSFVAGGDRCSPETGRRGGWPWLRPRAITRERSPYLRHGNWNSFGVGRHAMELPRLMVARVIGRESALRSVFRVRHTNGTLINGRADCLDRELPKKRRRTEVSAS
jgi:hypothetical protein